MQKEHCSALLIIAWCDLNILNLSRLQDYCPNPKCKCQKQITFTRKQFQIEGAGFRKRTKKNYLKVLKKGVKFFIEPGLKNGTPNFSAGVAAKTKNPQSAQQTNNIQESLTSGKI